MAAVFDPEGFAQRQLDAYNAHDLERFVAQYTEDVRVFNFPDPTLVMSGRAALEAHFRDNRFNLPGLRAELVNRMVIGNRVIDHERVHGLAEEPIAVAAIYEVREDGIAAVWFLRP